MAPPEGPESMYHSYTEPEKTVAPSSFYGDSNGKTSPRPSMLDNVKEFFSYTNNTIASTASSFMDSFRGGYGPPPSLARRKQAKTYHKNDLHDKAGLLGLNNMGNTCFMNSALQCLTHSMELNEYFLNCRYLDDLNRTNPLGMNGQVADSYGRLLHEQWPEADIPNIAGSVTPRDFKTVISKYAPQFAGFRQHDSHELLAFMLDGLHEDLNRILTKPYIDMSSAENLPDKELAWLSWQNYKKRNDSVIVDLFQGLFKSTITCPNPQCSHISVTFDPFMYLSLPIVKTQHTLISSLNVPFVSLDLSQPPVFVPHFEWDQESTVADVRAFVCKHLNLASVLIAYVSQGQVVSFLPNGSPISSISDPECLVAFESKPAQTPVFLSFEASASDMIDVEGEQTPQSLENVYPRLVYLDESYETITALKEALLPSLKQMVSPSGEDSWYHIIANDIPSKLYPSASVEFGSAIFHTISVLVDSNRVMLWGASQPLLSFRLTQEHTEDQPISNAAMHLYDCIQLFLQSERLNHNNLWYCSKCKGHQQAMKKFDLWTCPPKYLVIHLKRFTFSRIFREKISTFVDFPIEGLDLSQFLPSEPFPSITNPPALYDLYAISNHYGDLGGGHYTASAKHPLTNKWYYFNDSTVSEITNPEEIKGSSAYVLFYEKRMS